MTKSEFMFPKSENSVLLQKSPVREKSDFPKSESDLMRTSTVIDIIIESRLDNFFIEKVFTMTINKSYWSFDPVSKVKCSFEDSPPTLL